MEQKQPRKPKQVQLPCILESSGCGFLNGRTRELSEQEVSLQCPGLVYPGARKPKVGTSGILTFEFILFGNPREMLRMPCRIKYVISSTVGVQINLQSLNLHQRHCFTDLLDVKK